MTLYLDMDGVIDQLLYRVRYISSVDALEENTEQRRQLPNCKVLTSSILWILLRLQKSW